MLASLRRNIGRLKLAVLLLPLFIVESAPAQKLDLNANGISDVWEQIYGATSLSPNGDADGDGVSNLQESLAGTNPFDSNSVPRIVSVACSNGLFVVNIPSALGKRYQLQSIQPPANGGWSNWVTETSMVARAGTIATLASPIGSFSKLFRVAISDVDTDGDGLNDWEEYQLGLDPARASSSNQFDSNGQPLGDYAYAAGKLVMQNVVTISASDSVSSQPEPSQTVQDPGAFTVTRGGFPLNAINVNVSPDGPGINLATEGLDFAVLPRVLSFPAGVVSKTIPFTPLANPNLMAPAVARVKLAAGSGYTLGSPTNASVLVYPSPSPRGTGLLGQYFTNASSTYSSNANFNAANLKLTRLDASVDFNWGTTNTLPITNSGYYSIRWSGFVQPQYSETYYFAVNAEDGVMLWVNDQLLTNHWVAGAATDSVGSIDLIGGVRYNIKLEYFNAGGPGQARLSWYSASQPKQIIPGGRLYPANGTPAPSVVTSPLTATAFVASPFSYTVTGANSPTSFTAQPLPPGLGFTNGVISGVPALAGNFQILLTSSNAAGVGPSILNLQVIDTGSSVTREVWIAAAGTNISDIPVGTQPTATSFLGTLEGVTNYADNYGERIRGFLTAPTTGNYFFWLAASDSAELWISNDGEAVNKVRRAYVLPLGKGTAPRQWTLQPNQKSPWLALVAGQRYYLEILHKAGVGTNDNWSVGWLQDTTGTNNTPSGLVPGYVLSRYFQPAGAQAFTAPPAPPAWVDDHADPKAAARFLLQATYGPNAAEIAKVQAMGYAGWLNNQFVLPVSRHLTNVLANVSADPVEPYPSKLTMSAWWRQSVSAPDQLRQRVAFALSEILVVSDYGPLNNNGRALSAYYDTLLDNAFGNYRTLLKSVTLAPAMGVYLDMRGNDKGDITRGTHPSENYAREVLQLFSTGLNRRWPDGTLVIDSTGNAVPTYDQSVIMGFAGVFTGWSYYQTNQANGRLPANFPVAADYINPVVLVPSHHELGTKRLLDNVVLPPAQGSQADPASTNFDNYCQHDLEAAMDSIFYNETVAPYICRQLIQRLVTSNPGSDYLYRVVQSFKNNGAGVRGDLTAVIKAILLDYEARSATMTAQPGFGKQREPLLRVTALARAFPAPAALGGAYTQNGNERLILTTTNAHRLAIGDSVFIGFADTSGHAVPPSQALKVTGVNNATTFSVTAPGILAGTYKQIGGNIEVTCSDHGVSAGLPLYMVFSTGGATSGVYQVATILDESRFTLTTTDPLGRSGSCLFPNLTGGGFIQTGTNITVVASVAHELKANDMVYLGFQGLTGTNGFYRIIGVPDATHFVVGTGLPNNQTQSGLTVLPMIGPSMVRSGTALIRWNSWDMGYTEMGTSASLAQAPLRSPTVFNFFFPDYQLPGPLEAAHLTTPEFQLTSDTGVTLQMNFVERAVVPENANTNGLSSYNDGNGAVLLDMGPWMTPAYTSNAGIASLVDSLNNLLIAGQLSPAAKTVIINFVANNGNFAFTTPTYEEMRDRVQAVVHLLTTSPEFTIQR